MFADPMRVLRVTQSLLRQIDRHAEEAYPEECCGFLLGRDDDQDRTLVEALPAGNAFESAQRTHRFTIAPEQILSVEREADRRGLSVVGIYHSHPDSPARPSAYDREQAWPFYSYWIVSVQNGAAVDATSWQLDETTRTFAQETIKIT